MVTMKRVPGLVNQVPSPLDPGRRARLEPQVQSIYDHQLIIPAQAAAVTYFNQGYTGQSPQGVARSKRDTNMPSFPLPTPLVFLVGGFGVHIVQPAPAAAAFALTFVSDVNRLIYDGVLEFTVGVQGKGYLRGNLYQFPAGVGQYGFANTGGVTTGNVVHITTNGVPSQNNYFRIRGAPITLTQNESFGAEIIFPGGATSLSNTQTVAIILRGIQGKQIG